MHSSAPPLLTNRKKLLKRLVIASLALLVLIPSTFYLLYGTGTRPICNRLLDASFQQWKLETHGRTNTSCSYPNTKGDSVASLALMERYCGHEIQQYGYVPGLSMYESRDLVLMYMKEKTRHSWHSDWGHSIFSPAKWMVISPDILSGSCPEGGDLVDTPELKRRLLLTLSYLKEKQRPYWQTVTEEQLAFLNSIRE